MRRRKAKYIGLSLVKQQQKQAHESLDEEEIIPSTQIAEYRKFDIDSNPPEPKATLTQCLICATDFSTHSLEQQQQHLNDCLDQQTNSSAEQHIQPTQKCPICGDAIHSNTISDRIRHIKQCGKRNGYRASDFSTPTTTAMQQSTIPESLVAFKSTSRNSFDVLMSNAAKMFKTPSPKTTPTRATPATKRKSAFPSSSDRKRTGRCPPFKCIRGTASNIIVDGFMYACPQLSNVYVLTHFHADHYGGLSPSSFTSGIIYCTEITAQLVVQRLRLDPKYLHPLPLNTPYRVDATTEIIFIDANHCPGAALVLFRLKNKKAILHTGDFRFHPKMLQVPVLKPYIVNGELKASLVLDAVYLDTTYCDPKYTFPDQDKAVAAVVEVVQRFYAMKKTLFLFGSYSIGKERVFMEVAKKLNVKIGVDVNKMQAIKCFQWPPSTMKLLTCEKQLSDFHVVPMNMLNFDAMNSLLTTHHSRYHRVVAFRPTGWSYSSKRAGIMSKRSQNNEKLQIYGVPYSEHSSFKELCAFVKAFRPRTIIPTVNASNPKSIEEQKQLLHRACFDSIEVQLNRC